MAQQSNSQPKFNFKDCHIEQAGDNLKADTIYVGSGTDNDKDKNEKEARGKAIAQLDGDQKALLLKSGYKIDKNNQIICESCSGKIVRFDDLWRHFSMHANQDIVSTGANKQGKQ